MKYELENIKLVVTHNGIEQEIIGFDESTYVENLPTKKIKVDATTKSKRCKDTIDWVEVEYGDAYEKVKKYEAGY